MKKNSCGFTLVELMVALVIGLLVVLAAGQLFLVSKKNFDSMAYLSDRQETLLYLSELLSTDVRTAGNLHVYPESQVIEDDWPSCRNLGENAENILWLLFADSVAGELPGSDSSVRSSDPYCSASGQARALYAVAYYFDAGEGDLRVCYSCDDGSGSATESKQRLGLQRVASVSFDVLNPDVPVSRAGVEIEVEFESGGAEGGFDGPFILNVIRRSALLEALLSNNPN